MTRPILRTCEQRDLNDTESNGQNRLVDCPTRTVGASIHLRDYRHASTAVSRSRIRAWTVVIGALRCTDLRSIAGNRRYRLLAEWKYQESVHSRVSVCVVRESRTSSISTKYLCTAWFLFGSNRVFNSSVLKRRRSVYWKRKCTLRVRKYIINRMQIDFLLHKYIFAEAESCKKKWVHTLNK